MKQKLSITQKQTLSMKLQSGLRLLQMSTGELETFIADEVINNPFLIRDESANLPSYSNNSIATSAQNGLKDSNFNVTQYSQSHFNSSSDFSYDLGKVEDHRSKCGDIQSHLLKQASQVLTTDLEKEIAHEIILWVDDAGYLSGEGGESFSFDAVMSSDRLKNHSISNKIIEGVLNTIQSFDPLGVCARSLSECLKIQLNEHHFDPQDKKNLVMIIDKYLPLIADKKYIELQHILGISTEKIKYLLQRLKMLNPKPGLVINNHSVDYRTSDLFVKKNELGVWEVNLNHNSLPSVEVDSQQIKLLKQEGAFSSVVNDRLHQAKWVVDYIKKREQTILLVAKNIVEKQQFFFQHGIKFMRPIKMESTANELGINVSTVSRAVHGKYIRTPQGVKELKFFFTRGKKATSGNVVSTEVIKEHIRKIIASEPPEKPYSDDYISKALRKNKKMDIARRTIAKYRASSGIMTSRLRKKTSAFE